MKVIIRDLHTPVHRLRKTFAINAELVIFLHFTLKYLETYLFNDPLFVSGRVMGRIVQNGRVGGSENVGMK